MKEQSVSTDITKKNIVANSLSLDQRNRFLIDKMLCKAGVRSYIRKVGIYQEGNDRTFVYRDEINIDVEGAFTSAEKAVINIIKTALEVPASKLETLLNKFEIGYEDLNLDEKSKREFHKLMLNLLNAKAIESFFQEQFVDTTTKQMALHVFIILLRAMKELKQSKDLNHDDKDFENL